MKIIKDEAYYYSLRDEVVTNKDIAFQRISEAGLSRLLSRLKDASFTILTAYRGANSKDVNVTRNRNLRGEFDARKLGVYPLIGHWQECSLLDANGEPIEYHACPRNALKDVVERSYLVVKPETFPSEEFEDIAFNLGSKYGQDAIVFVGGDKAGVYESRSRGSIFKFGSSSPNVGMISQAFSQFVKNIRVPFVFEGIETPTALGIAKSALRESGFRWVED